MSGGHPAPRHVAGFATVGEVLPWLRLASAPGRTALRSRPPRGTAARARTTPASRGSRRPAVRSGCAPREATLRLPRLPRVVLRLAPQATAALRAAIEATTDACAGAIEVVVERVDALPDGASFSLTAWPHTPAAARRARRRDLAAVAALGSAIEAALAEASGAAETGAERHP